MTFHTHYDHYKYMIMPEATRQNSPEFRTPRFRSSLFNALFLHHNKLKLSTKWLKYVKSADETAKTLIL
jgi:hypothetical protein